MFKDPEIIYLQYLLYHIDNPRGEEYILNISNSLCFGAIGINFRKICV